MNDHSTCALQYGHLGRLKYDAQIKTWKFPRSLLPAPSLQYTGVTKTTVPSPFTVPLSSSNTKKSLIPQAYPELGFCWPQIHNETLSSAIARTSELCDPLVSSLIDVGYALDTGNDEYIPIVVLASGECGNAISLYKIDEDTVELRQDAAAEVRVPSIGKSEHVQWSLGGASVRQICFGQTVEEKATWMAARFPHCTKVFRPLYHRKPTSTSIYFYGEPTTPIRCGASRLDANPLVEISRQQTGGFVHADVAFNPWYSEQLGIVDVNGNWSIWNLTHKKQTKCNWTSKRSEFGSLPSLDNDDGQVTNNRSRHDGWAVIEWASAFNSFIVSDRRCPVLYRLENGQVYSFPIELDLRRPSEWILDIKRSTCNASHVFILTTSRVFWISITLDPASTAMKSTRRSLYPLMFWRHFRDPEDTTLQLSPLLVQQELYLVLSSRLSSLVLTFHCPTINDEYTDTAYVPDPFVLKIPPPYAHAPEVSMSPKPAYFSLCFKQINYLPSSVGKKHYDPATKLIKLFLLDSRLSVREVIYSRRFDEAAVDRPISEKDVLPLRRRYPSALTASSIQSVGGLIVDDGVESEFGDNGSPAPDIERSRRPLLAPSRWTLDYSHIYQIAFGDRIHQKKHTTKCLQDLIKDLNAYMSGTAVSQTLLEAFGSNRCMLDDIDQSTQELKAFISSILGTKSPWATPNLDLFVLRPPDLFGLPSSKVFGLEGASATDTLIDIYNRLTENWLNSLPDDIPGRARIRKDKIIHSVAADLALAQICVTHSLQESHEAAVDAPRSQTDEPFSDLENDVGTVYLRKGPSVHDNLNLESSGRTAVAASSATDDEMPDSAEDLAPVCSTLSSLTTFSTKRPISRATASMLQHWQLGIDPATSKWHPNKQTPDDETPRQVLKTTASQRKPRKKVPGVLQADSQHLSSSMPSASSAVPVVREWGSQPDNSEPAAMRLQSSQPVEEDLPMTQVERGLFGGREASRKIVTKTRKKKRAAGF